MHVRTTSRSVVAAAHAHPSGLAAPSAVIVTAIILFTLVTSVIIPALPPSLFGGSHPPAIRWDPGQPHYRIQSLPVSTGPPILPGLLGGFGWSAPSLTGGGQLVTALLPTSATGSAPGSGSATESAPGSGPALGVTQQLPPSSVGRRATCYLGQAPVSTITATVTGAGNAPVTEASNALRDTTGVLSVGTGPASATARLANVAGSTVRATGTLAASPTPTAPLTAPVSLGDTRSVTTQATQAPAAAATAASTALRDTSQASQAPTAAASATVTSVGNAVQSTVQVQGTARQNGSSKPTPHANTTPQASPGNSAAPVKATVRPGSTGSAITQASQTPRAAVTATVGAAGNAVQGTAQVQGSSGQGSSGQGSSGQGDATSRTSNAQASSGKSAVQVSAPTSANGSGSAVDSATQALSSTGTSPGVGLDQ